MTIEEQIEKECIRFADWLWKNVDEQMMSTQSWEYWYEEYKKNS